MQCTAEITAIGDKPYWVKRSEFIKCVDQSDFNCRESHVIKHAYCKSWFRFIPGEIPKFTIPAFFIKDGRVHFINGRHRTALLLQYLELLPMSFVPLATAIMGGGDESKYTLKRIVARELREDEVFELPELPFLHEEISC